MSLQPAIKFFSFTFCPFSQRTWIVLKKLNLKYEMIEGFKINENGVVFKDERLLQVNGQGTVPTFVIDDQVMTESIAIIEYLFRQLGGCDTGMFSQLVEDAYSIQNNVCAATARLMHSKDPKVQDASWNEFVEGLKSFVEKVEAKGFYKSNELNIVDITLFPFVDKLVMYKKLRGKSLDTSLDWVKKFHAWFKRMMNDRSVKDTMPDLEELMKLYK